MIKKVIISFCLALCLSKSQGQIYTGYNVALTLPAGTVIQDPTPYKLVFQDDFNGTTLDRTKWRTFKAWHGMSPNDHEYWEEGRVMHDRNVTLLDENVVVSGGYCNLLLFNKTNTWNYKTCPTCPIVSSFTKNASTGVLETYHKDPVTGNDVSWNLGKFEARIKFPISYKNHAAFWLYHADGGDACNEIDIAESYGDQWLPGPKAVTSRRVTASTHHYTPFRYENRGHYPNMSWTNYIRGNFFKQQEFHTYTCEWDLNRVKFYIDGYNWREVHKYYTTISFAGRYRLKVPAPDVVSTPTYFLMTTGFPWAYPTYTDLKFWNGQDIPMDPNYGTPVSPANSSVVIDHVRIWMRQPDGGHQDISNPCSVDRPKIIGPSVIPTSGSVSYSVDHPVTTSAWAEGIFGPPSALNITSPTSSSCLVAKNPSSTSTWGMLSYGFQKTGCPADACFKRIDFGTPVKPPVFVIDVNYEDRTKYIQIGAPKTSENTDLTYEWTINYGNQRTFHAFGQYISTPIFDLAEPADVNWTLTVSNAVGSSTFQGSKPNTIFVAPQIDSFVEENDTVSFYYNAKITDTTFYEAMVDTMLDNEYVHDTTDTVAINSLIEKIRFQELEPYLIYDTTTNDTSNSNFYRRANLPIESTTKIYPSPANNILNIDLGTNYILEEPKHLQITNMSGAVVLSKDLSTTTYKNTIELGQLASGIYIIEISQKGLSQKTKFTKL